MSRSATVILELDPALVVTGTVEVDVVADRGKPWPLGDDPPMAGSLESPGLLVCVLKVAGGEANMLMLIVFFVVETGVVGAGESEAPLLARCGVRCPPSDSCFMVFGIMGLTRYIIVGCGMLVASGVVAISVGGVC